MLRIVKETIIKHDMPGPGRKMAVALSGGVDSVVLLHLLKELGYGVFALHFEHGIRGESSLKDMDFVSALCAKEGIACEIGRGNVPDFARAKGVSLEVAARELRYAFLESAMEKNGLDVCATAHHLDDQAETIIMRLARGASDGLAGIPYVNGPFVRPLRDVPKRMIVEYAKKNGLSYVEDETNADTDIERNLVRNLVLPKLCEINPAAAENIARSMSIAADALEYVNEAAQKALSQMKGGLDTAVLKALPEAVQRSAVALFLEKAGAGEFSHRNVAAVLALDRTGMRADIKGLSLINEGGIIREMEKRGAKFCVEMGALPENRGEALRINFPAGLMTVELVDFPVDAKTPPNMQFFDMDKLAGFPGLCIRSRKDGDRISPIGSGGKKLKELFIDRKISSDRRDKIPLVASGGEILWAAGEAASSKIALDESTKRVLLFKYIETRQR
ncbi:MAG: tRNA lysidine(34) synthetase TilS [Christensenellales bacterium]